jgi:hypothetical protein
VSITSKLHCASVSNNSSLLVLCALTLQNIYTGFDENKRIGVTRLFYASVVTLDGASP